ncbi:MAG: hypothetical protein IJ122_06400 [Methanobrevibacter sp.]|nr:hypothetical protein [Methanobrevibacter sp.]
MKWTNRKSMTYDSFEESYMIFIRRNKEFNEIARWNIPHICLIKDEKIIKTLVKRLNETNKKAIYIKRAGARNIFEDYDLADYNVIAYKTSIKEEKDDIKERVLLSIDSIKNENLLKTKVEHKIEEDEDDEELDEELLST